MWARLDALINPARQASYGEAAVILCDLRDLAVERSAVNPSAVAKFEARVADLRSRNAGRRNLITTLDQAKLVGHRRRREAEAGVDSCPEDLPLGAARRDGALPERLLGLGAEPQVDGNTTTVP